MKILDIIFEFLDKWYKDKLFAIQLWTCKKEATRLHKITGKRYWVLKTESNTLIVVNKLQIKESNRKLDKAGRTDILKLVQNALYVTE